MGENAFLQRCHKLSVNVQNHLRIFRRISGLMLTDRATQSYSAAMEFGRILRDLRKNAGLGIKRLAPELGVNYTFLSRLKNVWVRGRRL